jgi:hypothetical protein
MTGTIINGKFGISIKGDDGKWYNNISKDFGDLTSRAGEKIEFDAVPSTWNGKEKLWANPPKNQTTSAAQPTQNVPDKETPKASGGADRFNNMLRAIRKAINDYLGE